MDPSMMPIPPQPWQIVASNTGRLFYFNPMTQQQSLVPPPGSVPVQQLQMPQQPLQQQTTQNVAQQQSFINNNTKINSGGGSSGNSSGNNSLNNSSSSIKQSLPEGWEEDIDPQGRVYYIDHINRKTSWIHPSFSQSLHSNTPKLGSQGSGSGNNNTTVPSQPISTNNSNNNSSGNNNIAYPSFNEYNNNNNNNNVYNVNSPMVSSSLPKVIPSPIKPPQQQNGSNTSDSYRPRNISAPSPPVRIPSFTPTTTTAASLSTSPSSQQHQHQHGSSSKSNALLSHTSPLWDLEKLVPSCSNCYSPFTVIKRRHHCRCCYREFCDACTLQRIKIPQFNFTDPVRVCDYCFNHTSANEKTCIARLIPYLFDNYRDVNQQYQALLEIYDFVLSNQNHANSIEAALVGGLKPFLEFVVRSTKEKDKSEAVALCCQVMAFTCKYEKLLKFISEKDQIISLFEVMALSSNSSVITDCAKVIKSILIRLKNNNNNSSSTTTSTTNVVKPNTPTTNNANNNNNNNNQNVIIDLLVSKSCLSQFMTTIEQPNNKSKSKEDIQLECLKIVKRLVQHENTALALVECNAVEVITPLLLTSRQDIIKRVLKTLLTFVEYDNNNSEKIATSGGVLYLSELFFKQLSPNNNIYILMLLNYIIKSKYSIMIIESEGLIDNLLEQFNSNPTSKEFKELVFLIDSLYKANQQQQQNQTYISQVICSHKEFLNILVNECTRIPELESVSLDILVNLCLIDECKETLRSIGIIDPLLQVICEKSKSPIIPLKILGNLAKNNLDVCTDIFEVGGLTVLIDLLVTPPPQPTKKSKPTGTPAAKVPYTGDIEDLVASTLEDKENEDNDEKKLKEYNNTQIQIVKLLAMLSYSKNIVKEFVNFENGNGIKILVSLMNPSKDDAIKEIATEALSNLCENETCAILVISEGGLNYAMGLLASSHTQIKTNTLKLIQKLVVHSPDIKLAISEGTSIQKIVEMLSNSNPELKKCAIFSLAELCRENESNRDLAFKCGCLPTLVNLFNSYTEDIKTLVCVLEILSGFVSQNEQYRTMILNTDLMQSIIEYLFTSGVNGSNGDSFVIQAQVHSVHILSLLIKENSTELIKRVLDSGIILSLIPLLSINNSYLQEYTLATLKKISKSTTTEIRDTMISSGILASLSNLLSSKNESILTNNLYILIELSKSQDCGGFLLSTNAVAQISELVISPNTPQPVKELSILLISSLFETSSNNSNIWEVFTSKAGIPGIVALLSSPNNSLAVSAANSLSTIVVDGPGRARVVESGGLSAILLAMKSSDANLASSSLITIYGLSLEDELCELIVDMGALESLASMLSNDYKNTINVDTKLYACETIFNLSSNPQCRSLICQNQLIVPSLIDLLFSENPNHKNAACKTIALLAADANTAKFVSENGGVIGLIPLLSPKHDEMTLISSSLALTNLAKHHPESKPDILVGASEDGTPGIATILKILGSAGQENHSVRVDLQILELLELLCEYPQFPAILHSSSSTGSNSADENNSSSSISNLLSLLISTSSRKESTSKEEAHSYCTVLFKTLSIIVYLSSNQEIRKSLPSNEFLKTLSSLLTPPPETLVSLDDTGSSLSSLLDIQEKENLSQNTQSNILKSIESNQDKEEINKLSMILIYTLSLTEEGKHSIRNLNLISVLVRFLNSKLEDQICLSLKTLTSLSLSSLNRIELFNNGGFDRILDLLCNSNQQQVLLYSLYAINNLIILEQNYSTFIKRDCLQHLVKCLSIQFEPLQIIAVNLINRHLTISKCVEEFIEKYSFINLLVGILNNASSEHLILLVLKTMNDFIPFDCARTSMSTLLPKEILVALQSVPNLSLRELSSNLLSMGGYLP